MSDNEFVNITNKVTSILKSGFNSFYSNIQEWGNKHLFKMLVFNTILMFLVLMRSAGYFLPFFGISVNFIVLSMLVLSIFLLNSNSKTMFITAFLLWMFAALMKVLKIDIWAERTAIYTFEALFIGTILLIIESVKPNGKS